MLHFQGVAEALVGISKKLMEKSVKDGKPWVHGLPVYRVTPVSGNLPLPLEALTGCKPRTSLSQIIPSSVGKSMETSRIWHELLRRQPSTSNDHRMELEPGQPIFVKEVTGNVWKTGVINQPAKEPESYWIKFPDNSILRRMRSMIKPRFQLSYFELEAEGKEWNDAGIVPPCSHNPFTSKLPELELPALPMSSLVPQPLTIKAVPSGQINIPVISTSEVQPSITSSSGPAVLPSSPRCSSCSTKGIPPVRLLLPRNELCTLEHYGSQWKGYFILHSV